MTLCKKKNRRLNLEQNTFLLPSGLAGLIQGECQVTER